MPYAISFSAMILWSTASNAFFRSKNSLNLVFCGQYFHSTSLCYRSKMLPKSIVFECRLISSDYFICPQELIKLVMNYVFPRSLRKPRWLKWVYSYWYHFLHLIWKEQPWPSGKALDSGQRCPGFEAHCRPLVMSGRASGRKCSCQN